MKMQVRVVRRPKPLVGITQITILSAIILCLNSPALIFAQTSTNKGGVEPQISIGVLVPQTGPDAQVGVNMRAAVEFAMQQINYRAGGYRLVLHWIDEGDDPTRATRNYERAIVADRIQVGFLGWRSDAAVALMPVVARYKIPHLFGVGATEIINEKFKSDEGRFGYWTTKIYPVPGKVSGAYADAITAAVKRGDFVPSSMTVALYAEDTD
jgi:branched-chain amino acid transport system substrate-binding protein